MIERYSYDNIDEINLENCQVTNGKDFIIEKDKEISVDIKGTKFSATVQTEKKIKSICKKYKNALVNKSIDCEVYNPLAAFDGKLKNNGTDTFGNPLYEVIEGTEELSLAQISHRTACFVNINNRLSENNVIEKIICAMPKKKNGMLYAKRVTQIASLFCMEKDATMNVLCAVAKSENEFVIEVRKVVFSDREKIDADVFSVTNYFSNVPDESGANNKSTSKDEKLKKYLEIDAKNEESTGPVFENMQQQILAEYLIENRKVDFTIQDLIEYENGELDSDIEKTIDEFLESFNSKVEEYIKDYVASKPKIKKKDDRKDYEIEEGVLKQYKGDRKNVTIPEDVKMIADRAFQYCWWVNKIVMSDEVIEIGENAFEGCEQLSSVKLSNRISKIGNYAFDRAGIEKITLPATLGQIEEGTFWSCSNIKSIELAEGLRRIGKSAFSGCKLLDTITIPETVEEIDSGAFDYCKNLTKVIIKSNKITINKDAFANCSDKLVILSTDESDAKAFATKNKIAFEVM